MLTPQKLCKCQDFQGENALDLDAFREIVNDGAEAATENGQIHRVNICHRLP